MNVIPKIIFRKMTLEENIEIIKWAYFEDNGLLSVHDYTIEYFPELADLDKSLSKDEIYKIIEKVVAKNYTKYEKEIELDVNRYNNLWEKYNDLYFTNLSKYFNVEWVNDSNIIDASVGLIPTFPRYLDTNSFSIGTNVSDIQLIEVSAHETLHFWWFIKWKKLYPEISRRQYDSPYLSWQYSEMVTDPILNNPPFNKIFDFLEEKGYDSFYEMYDGDELVMDKLRDIYKEDISIDDKIKKGFEYIKSIKNKILKSV